MEYNCVDDLFKKREDYGMRRNRFIKTIHECEENTKKAKRQTKNYWKSLSNEYKKIVFEIDENIKYTDMLLSELATFPTDILMPFIVKCMNEIEDEEYTYKKLYVKFAFDTREVQSLSSNFIINDFIFPLYLSEEVNKLERSLFLINNYDFYKELLKKYHAKYFLEPTNNNTNVFVIGEKLLISFPYIEEILYNVVNRRISEPNTPLDKILNEELMFIKEIELKKLLVNKGHN